MDLNSIKTEQRNSRTAQIDTMSTLSMVKLINEEDKKVAVAVGDEAEHIAQAVDVIAAQLKQGGRLVYSGCGTSGRLGILDAVECPPTYSTDPGEVIGLIAGALFGGSGLVAASAYFIGVAAIVISGIILKKTKMFAGDPAPFVMELPAYHIPSVGNVLRATWERGWSFIKRAGTVILASSIILWFLQGFGWENGAFGLVEDMNNSVLAAIGSAVAFIFAPLGFGNWRATVAVVTGLIAKENVVATFGVLYNFAGELSENGDEIWALVAQDYTAISAYSFMIFNLLCAPCFAAMGAIKREMNNAKWTAFAIGYMCVFAYVVSLIVYQIGGLITGEVSFGIGTVVAVVLVVGIVYLLFRKNKYEDERLTIRSVDAAGRRAALK